MRLHPEKVASGSLSSIANLCNALDISLSELTAARKLSPQERYQSKSVPKKDGSERSVHNPHHLIRKIQRRINRRIFANHEVIAWPDHVFGSIPNDDLSISPAADKDYVNCARQHCGAKSILSVDIKDFFDNIHCDQVFAIFRDFLKYPESVSKALADICCMDTHVVQGALTSSYIATLCLHAVEGGLVKRLHHKGLTYTRLVDDITVSSKIANYDFGFALAHIEKMLHAADLPLNHKKTRTQFASMRPLIVHGLRVDFKEPRLPPDEPKRIRAAVTNLELLAGSPGYRASRAYRKDFNRCMGRVNKLGRVEHNQHAKLLARVLKVLPLPSHMDIERAERQVARLERDFLKPNYSETYWFYKRYYVASERLGILKRSFPMKAAELRAKLQPMRPEGKYE
jgi:RNA-directed DNA polymerase